MNPYELIDSGNGLKLEDLGGNLIVRPAANAFWPPFFEERWEKVDFSFERGEEKKWTFYKRPLENWNVEVAGVKFRVKLTDFGHIGFFPEHAYIWNWLRVNVKPGFQVLNLFAYSGGATIALAQTGAKVCHVDASRPIVDWARINASLNGMDKAPVRWIVDDVFKFLKKEIKRESFYDGVILDPPSFGRGSKGELFKLEDDILALLQLCRTVLKKEGGFLIFTTHTPGFTPLVLQNILLSLFKKEGQVSCKELSIPSKSCPLPAGTYALWRRNA